LRLPGSARPGRADRAPSLAGAGGEPGAAGAVGHAAGGVREGSGDRALVARPHLAGMRPPRPLRGERPRGRRPARDGPLARGWRGRAGVGGGRRLPSARRRTRPRHPRLDPGRPAALRARGRVRRRGGRPHRRARAPRPARSGRDRPRRADPGGVRPGWGARLGAGRGDGGEPLRCPARRRHDCCAGQAWPGARPVVSIDPALIEDCVHCGFCLPTCPTYGPLWQQEMDSPRGRIWLMKGLVEGTVELTDTTVAHFDRCLGCMACMTACPSGVRYDRLLDETRVLVEERYQRRPDDWLLRRLVFAVFPYPSRLRLALALAPFGRKLPLPGFLRPLAELAPPWRATAGPAALTPALGERRARVGLL